MLVLNIASAYSGDGVILTREQEILIMPRISFPTYIRLVDCCREDALMSVLSNPKDSTKSLRNSYLSMIILQE